MQFDIVKENPKQPFFVKYDGNDVTFLPEIDPVGFVFYADKVFIDGEEVEQVDEEIHVQRIVHQRGPFHSYYTEVYLDTEQLYSEPFSVEIQDLSMDEGEYLGKPENYPN